MQGFAPHRNQRLLWMLMLLVLLALPTVLQQFASQELGAQEPGGPQNAPPAGQPAASGDPAEPSAGSSSAESFGGMVLKSGTIGVVFYVILGVFSLVAVTIALERLVNLKRMKVIPAAFGSGLLDLVRRGDGTAENFQRLCESSPSPIANVLKAAVARAGRPLPEVEKAMEDTIARETASLRSRHRPLSVIGNVAPLVGLLGTVVGMIFAFRTATQMGVGKGESLSEGIYLALITTAAGLTIAIPCLLLAAWFNARCERFMRDIDESLLETLPSFAGMENTEILHARVPATQAGSQTEAVPASQT